MAANLGQALNKAISSAFRGAGAALENAGRALEVNPHVDKCKPSWMENL